MLMNCLEGFKGSRCDRGGCLPPAEVCHFVEAVVWKKTGLAFAPSPLKDSPLKELGWGLEHEFV